MYASPCKVLLSILLYCVLLLFYNLPRPHHPIQSIRIPLQQFFLLKFELLPLMRWEFSLSNECLNSACAQTQFIKFVIFNKMVKWNILWYLYYSNYLANFYNVFFLMMKNVWNTKASSMDMWEMYQYQYEIYIFFFMVWNSWNWCKSQ